MFGKIPALPPVAPEPVKVAPKPPPPESASAAPRPAEHPEHHSSNRHPSAALSPADISYVDGLLGIAPAQIMEHILLKTGIPRPANLGQDLDTSA